MKQRMWNELFNTQSPLKMRDVTTDPIDIKKITKGYSGRWGFPAAQW